MTNLKSIKKNEHYFAEITDMGSEGEGICKINGFAVFVENAVTGDFAEVRIVKVKKNCAYAKLINIISASPIREEPICKSYYRCGGCNLQHISYKAGLEFKKNKVKSCLERIGGFKNIFVEPTIGLEEHFNYRNKAQMPVGEDNNGIKIGFYEKRSHNIIDCRQCCIQNKANEKIIEAVRKFIEEYNIKPYDEKTHTGIIRHIITRVGEKTGEILVSIVINSENLKHSDSLIKTLLYADKNIVGIVLNINKERTNVIMGDRIKVIWGKGYITDYIEGLKFEISSLSFYQVNPRQTEVLYKKVLEFAQLKGDETVIDAYCGIGTISLFLARKAKKVYAIEIIEQAIEDAKRNALINGIENTEFFVGKSEQVIKSLYSEKGINADVIVVDPPRKGCDFRLLETISQMKPKKVVYVSCDPATLARDLKILCQNGFEIKKVQPVDMFCMSSHVECVVLMSRVEK